MRSIFVLILCVVSISCKAVTQQDSAQYNRKRKYNLALKYLTGTNTETDYKKARILLNQLAKSNYAPAMRTWGTLYNNGLGVIQNKERAFKAYYKAAALGDAKSMTNIGLMYQNGDYVKQNYNKAFEWYQKGLQSGDIHNYYNIGYLYYKGYGVEQNYEKALEYFHQGASNNKEGICKYMIGFCYIKGYGVEQNIEYGKRWIEQAANKGYERAIDFISRDYLLKNIDSLNIPNIHNNHICAKRNKMNEINLNNISPIDIIGFWEGELLQYDWSGKTIEAIYPLSLNVIKNNEYIEGFWEINDEQIAFTATNTESTWQINATPYHAVRGGKEQIYSATLYHYISNKEEQLQGELRIQRLKTNEPAPPNKIFLTKQKNKIEISDCQYLQEDNVTITPNPIEHDQIIINVFATKDQEISCCVYSSSGVCLMSQIYFIQSGENSIILPATFPVGMYVLSVTGQEFRRQVKFIK